MTGYSPLLDAMQRVADEPFASHKVPWNGVALVYGGALLQMYKTAPANRRLEGIKLPNTITSLDSSQATLVETIKNPNELQGLCKELIPVIIPLANDECSLIASDFVKLLGFKLYQRLNHLLASDPFGMEWLGNDLFHPKYEHQQYSLVLAHTRVCTEPGSNSDQLQELLRPALPEKGWTKTSKVWPPFVRIIPWLDSETRPKIHYLRSLLPQVDEQLRNLPVSDGLRLAALPLARNLVFGFDKIGTGQNGNTLVRIAAPDPMPMDWQETLTRQILECSEKRIAVAVLPELSVSPAMMEVIRTVLKQCDNGFPILVAAGSWHLDEQPNHPNGRFVNRLTLISSAFPEGEILQHDKFETFTSNGVSEGNVSGDKGFTWLVTGLGIIGLGICKDWFVLRPESSPVAWTQICFLRPLLGLIPALTSTCEDLLNLAVPLKETGCILLTANNCGTVKSRLRNNECCKIERKTGTPCRDVRSFISVPKSWYELTDGHNGENVTESNGGIFIGRAPCSGAEDDNPPVNHNTVFAWVIPQKFAKQDD